GPGDCGHAAPARRAMLEHKARRLEETLHHADADDAVRLEESVRDLVRTGHCAGVRVRDLAAHAGASELVGDHGFAQGDRAARCAREVMRIPESLEKQQYRPGVGIIHQHVRDLPDAEITFIADRNQLGKAQAAGLCAGKQSAERASALGDYTQRAGLEALLPKHGIDRERHRALHVDDSHAVGTEEPQAARARHLHHLFLPREAVLAKLCKAGAEHRRYRHFALAALLDYVRHGPGRYHDEYMVHRIGHRAQVGIGFGAEDFAAAGIDGYPPPAIAMLFQEP